MAGGIRRFFEAVGDKSGEGWLTRAGQIIKDWRGKGNFYYPHRQYIVNTDRNRETTGAAVNGEIHSGWFTSVVSGLPSVAAGQSRA